MKIVLKSTTDLVPYEKNPRKNEPAVELVAASIREFGFRQPIVIDVAGVIVAGHTRWKAAQLLGLAKVPCVIADDLTPEQIRAYRLADNKTGEFAEWDLELLDFELSELDLDMTAFGFDLLENANGGGAFPIERGRIRGSGESSKESRPKRRLVAWAA